MIQLTDHMKLKKKEYQMDMLQPYLEGGTKQSHEVEGRMDLGVRGRVREK